MTKTNRKDLGEEAIVLLREMFGEGIDFKSLSANKQLWYNSHQRRWKKWKKRATSHGQYPMRFGRP